MEQCTQEKRLNNLEERVDKNENLITDIRLMMAKQTGTITAIVGLIAFLGNLGGLLIQYFRG